MIVLESVMAALISIEAWHLGQVAISNLKVFFKARVIFLPSAASYKWSTLVLRPDYVLRYRRVYLNSELALFKGHLTAIDTHILIMRVAHKTERSEGAFKFIRFLT